MLPLWHQGSNLFFLLSIFFLAWNMGNQPYFPSSYFLASFTKFTCVCVCTFVCFCVCVSGSMNEHGSHWLTYLSACSQLVELFWEGLEGVRSCWRRSVAEGGFLGFKNPRQAQSDSLCLQFAGKMWALSYCCSAMSSCLLPCFWPWWSWTYPLKL